MYCDECGFKVSDEDEDAVFPYDDDAEAIYICKDCRDKIEVRKLTSTPLA